MVEPLIEGVEVAFQARRAIETGILLTVAEVTQPVVDAFRNHVAQQRAASVADHVTIRGFLLINFHVCRAETVGNHILVDPRRDLTARTILIAPLYQLAQDA